jgi:NAD(P)H-nitrite reductase large subunit
MTHEFITGLLLLIVAALFCRVLRLYSALRAQCRIVKYLRRIGEHHKDERVLWAIDRLKLERERDWLRADQSFLAAENERLQASYDDGYDQRLAELYAHIQALRGAERTAMILEWRDN